MQHNLEFTFILDAGSTVAEFPVSICSTAKFNISSDDGEPRLLITEMVHLIKVTFTKTG